MYESRNRRGDDEVAACDDATERVSVDRAGAGSTTQGWPARSALPQLASSVQRKAGPPRWQADYDNLWSLLSGQSVQRVAAAGVEGRGASLPHLDAIQSSFGRHDVSGVRAQVGGDAATAATAIGAEAYATGDAVAFRAEPDLHTAAHEAAHVVQQRVGVQLYGGVGEVGDPYERHADAVADAVVAGRSAEPLLDAFAGHGATSTAVQRKGASPSEVGDIVGGLGGDASGLSDHVSALKLAKIACMNVLEDWRAGSLPSARAMTTLIDVIHGMYAPLHAFADAKARLERGPTPALARELERWMPDVSDALNSAKRVAMLITPSPVLQLPLGFGYVHTVENQLPDDVAARTAQLDSAVVTLQIVGADVGWVPPATLHEADLARYAHEACPTGARRERPEACLLTDSERVERRGDVKTRVINVIDSFRAACAPHLTTLGKMISRQQALREKVIGTFVGTLSSGLGAITSGAAAAFVNRLGTEVGKAALSSFAGPVEGEGTKNFVEALIEAMRARLTLVAETVRTLDDESLVKIGDRLERLDVATFTDALTPLVQAYQAQIDPLGRDVGGTTRLDLNLPPGTQFEYEAVTVKLPRGPRLAQVAHEANDTPHDGPTHGATYHRYIFVRWIDEQFAPVVGAAQELDAQVIEGLAFGDVIGGS